MNQIDPIFSRKSSVNFSGEEIDNIDLNAIVKAAMWAPSSRNKQPWKLIAIKNSSQKFNSIIESCSESNKKWARKAGVIIVFCTQDSENTRTPEIYLDIGFAGQNAMIKATSMGYENHPYGGWNEDAIKNILTMPNNSNVVFLLAIGPRGDLNRLSDELLEKHNKNRDRNPIESHFNLDSWSPLF
jgi:nitroreductase